MSPLLWLLPAIALLAVLGSRLQAYPRRRFVLVAIVPAVLSLLLLVWPGWLWGLVFIDVLIVVLAAADLFTLPRRKNFSVERQSLKIASLGKPHRVTLTLLNHSRRRRRVLLRDGVPQELNADPAEFDVTVPARSRAMLHYDLRPSRRGAFAINSCFLEVSSALGLWRRILKYEVPDAVNVYPDMQQLSQYAVLARTNRLSLLGVRRTRRVGQDNEFERLRDYTRDDSPRHIDWRSTARRSKLTVKDFQANQSQRVIFLIDCGRMMTNEAAGLTLLDHALNSMLMMAYVALAKGDAVGLVCFSDGIHSFVPPRGGLSQMNRLLHASFDRFPRLVESRYDEAFLHLASRCRKRSLVVLMTSIIDEVNANQLQRYLAAQVGKHLPLGVLLRDRQMFAAVERGAKVMGETLEDALPHDEASLFTAAASADLLGWRQQVLRDLSTNGVLTLDLFPEDLTAPLVNAYLNVKARHLL